MAVTDEAIEKIKEMIVNGGLRPGDRLPREADLAAELGLSRSSLREAVRALSLIHVLDVRQGDGTYVTSLEPARLLEAMSFVVDFHRDDTVLEFLEVRRILEPAATAMAAQRITDEEVAALREHLDAHRQRADGRGPGRATTWSSTAGSRPARGNVVLGSLLDSLSGPTTRARVWRGLTQEGALTRTLMEHTAILDALAERDSEGARAWATIHIVSIEQWLRNTLSEKKSPQGG